MPNDGWRVFVLNAEPKENDDQALARYVVTRDKDLLVVKEFRQVKFVNPQEFVIAFRSAME